MSERWNSAGIFAEKQKRRHTAALDWTKTPKELEKEKRWKKLWQETYGDEKKP